MQLSAIYRNVLSLLLACILDMDQTIRFKVLNKGSICVLEKVLNYTRCYAQLNTEQDYVPVR